MVRNRLGMAALLLLSCGARSSSGEAEPPRPVLQLVQAQQPAPPPGGLLPGGVPTLAPLVERVRPTVVGVSTRVRGDGSVPPEVEEFWRRFFGDEAPPLPDGPRGPAMGVGSGVIVDPKGVVLTNNHVVEGAAEVRVRTADEKEYSARVLGNDPETDIAVLQLDGVEGPLPAATLGSSDAVRVGDFVVAIGNPFGLELTVTSGIVSAKARVIGAGPYDDFLQTDAAINPGNSGGPLFDLQGNVVGINTAIVATGAGIGFAVPIDLVRALLPQLVEKGRVVRGYLGVGIQDLTPELAQALGMAGRKGALVAQVEPGAPASRALEAGDVVVAVEGEKVEGAAQLSRRVAQIAPGKQVALTVIRDGKERRVQVKLGERPGPDARRQERPRTEESDELGLTIQDLPPETARRLEISSGVLVAEVRPGSRAAEAGLQPGDVIVEAAREPVRNREDLARAAKAAGRKPLLLRVIRDEGAAFVVIPPAPEQKERKR